MPSYFECTGAADAGSQGSLSREPSVPGTRLGLPLDRLKEQALVHAAPASEMLSGYGAPWLLVLNWIIGRQEPCVQASSSHRTLRLLASARVGGSR